MIQLLKFGMDKKFHPKFLLDMWLIVHAGIQINLF